VTIIAAHADPWRVVAVRMMPASAHGWMPLVKLCSGLGSGAIPTPGGEVGHRGNRHARIKEDF
jgi:hypothetical protein